MHLDGYCGQSSGVVTFDGSTMTFVKPLVPDHTGCGDSESAVAVNNGYYAVFNSAPTMYTATGTFGDTVVYLGDDTHVVAFVDPDTVPERPTDASSWVTFPVDMSSDYVRQLSGQGSSL